MCMHIINIYIYTRLFGRVSRGLDSFQVSGTLIQSDLEAHRQMTSKHLCATALTLISTSVGLADPQSAALCEDTLMWMVACILLNNFGTKLEAIASIRVSLVTSCPLLGLFVHTHSTLVAPPGRRDGSGSWEKTKCFFYRFSVRN